MRFLILAGLSLIMVGGSFCLNAQPTWQTWNTTNSAIPDNSVTAIAADSSGNLWIGTENGLARFDGAAFSVFTTANSALPDNAVRALTADAAGIWVGTFTGGLARGMGNSFTVYNTNNSGLPENQIRDLEVGPQGELWIGTSGGLARFQNNQFTVWNTTNSGLTSNNITAIALHPDGSRYLGTINGGLLHHTDSSVQVFNFLNSQLPDNSALALSLTSTGELLIGTTTAGLAVLQSDSLFQVFSPQNSGNLTYTVPALANDGAANWFLGSELAGLIYRQGNSWESYQTQNSGIPANHVQTLFLQNPGILWIGTRTGGLARLTYQPLSVTGSPADLSVYVFPNPVKPNRPIRLSRPLHYPRISVRNSTGRVVLEQKLGGKTEVLPAFQLPAGLYLLQIVSEEGYLQQQLVLH